MKQIDLFGNERELPERDWDSPTEAWVEGWTAGMHDGSPVNPYELGDDEYRDWQEGYEAAERTDANNASPHDCRHPARHTLRRVQGQPGGL